MSQQSRSPNTGLRDVARASALAHLTEEAMRLFDEQGFDRTTVDDIAQAVGISSRSFFRYFAAKEDVVLGDPSVLGALVRDAAAATPERLPAWTVLRRGFTPIEVSTAADAARGLRVMRVMTSSSSLRARNLEKHALWAIMLEPVVAARLEGPEEDRLFRARSLIGAALSCLDVALVEWTRQKGATPVRVLLDEAFAAARE